MEINCNSIKSSERAAMGSDGDGWGGGGGGCMVGAYARLGVCANKYGIFVLFKLV